MNTAEKYSLSDKYRAGKTRRFRLHPLSLLLMMGSTSGWAEDYFDPGLLSLGRDVQDVDLSQFAEAGSVAEGDYLVTIFVNQNEATTQMVEFSRNNKGLIAPELTPDLLETLGVNVNNLPALKDLPKDKPVEDLPALIPDAFARFNLSKLRLDISVPQVAMQPNINSRIDTELWDDGIPALLANYSLSLGRNEQTSNQNEAYSNNLFANINAGANVGPWRLRSTITQTSVSSGGGNRPHENRDHTQFSNTNMFRDIRGLRSTVLMGESSSGSEVFDSVPFRGVQLSSNEQMLPNRLRGFAPVVSGIANSNARVTIRQNGHVVYETFVAPGPFEIKDIYQAGMSGDLDVTVTETDGSIRNFVVPFSSLPVMLRPGSLKYEITAGRYDGGVTVDSRQADFALGTLIYGLPKNITLYGGALVAQDYTSLTAGSGISLGPVGALSADMTQSSAQFESSTKQTGESYRLRYSKNMLSTGTSFDLTALRYSTRNYYSFNDFNDAGYQLRDDQTPWRLDRQRSSFQTQINQQLGNSGSLSLRAAQDDYWGSDTKRTSLAAGYSGSYRGVSYGLFYTIDQMKGQGNWPENRQASLNISIPLNVFSNSSKLQNTYASTQVTHDNNGRSQTQAGVTGSSAEGAFNYGMMESWGNQGQVSNSNLNMGYQGSKVSLNSGYSYSTDSRAMNINASGGMIAHSQGVTLSRTLGSSMALVSAPGAAGVNVTNGGAITDGHGYAVAPYLSDYAKNSIGLDPASLPENVDLPYSNLNVYPTKGAVVKADFKTRLGYQVLMTLNKSEGAVPFGATVSLVDHSGGQEDNAGIVSDMGQVYLTGLPEEGVLLVSWGKSADKQCHVDFNLKGLAVSPQMPIIQTKGECR